MKEQPITHRQREVLEFVRDAIAQTGVAPKYDDIARHLGITKVSAYERVSQLVRYRLLARRRRRARGLTLTPAGRRAATPLVCPHCGQPVAALSSDQSRDRQGANPATGVAGPSASGPQPPPAAFVAEDHT